MAVSKCGSNITQLLAEVKDRYEPDVQVTRLRRLGIGYTVLGDSSYPELLGEAADAPVILYVKGSIESIGIPGIAVVGSRKYTYYGRDTARYLSAECAKAGLSIISGLALGIDAEAHRATLAVGGSTVAVLGCGLDQVYPAGHAGLAREIVEKGGALVSEFSPGTPPIKPHFPMRNRIIAGLAIGTLVIEAGEKSGALITAYSALESNREVFAVPGNIDSETSKGTNQLIKEGAKLVTSAEDIFEELEIKVTLNRDGGSSQDLSQDEKIIIDLLSKGVCPADDMLANSGMNVISLNTVLTALEMKGMVENMGGGRYRRTQGM
ncbi:MAG: hypothetical protein BWY68_00675 [bacterium ADurb.Bin400]|nr:MAG: hypothetical protein BWY68_00675 [bacterium ADurb.Bin400]